jgi:hypothetical protein
VLEGRLAAQVELDQCCDRAHIFGQCNISDSYRSPEVKRSPNQSNQSKTNNSSVPKKYYNYNRGDKVVVTNQYKGLKGTRGTVTKVTDNRVFFRDYNGYVHSRAPQNIRFDGLGPSL